jgi:ABC-type bacteriocin/lantibiotic exporter with double-glycine peptidase domain
VSQDQETPGLALVDIPYEAQRDPWSCGAASLCMVYASLGQPAHQEEVHQRMRPDPRQLLPRGRSLVELARDLLARGLAALPLRAAHPWAALQACCNASLRVILRHRLQMESPRGHFSVLRGIAPDAVILHDPTEGPDFRVRHERFLALWDSLLTGYEDTRFTLVAIQKKPDQMASHEVTCPLCALPIEMGSFLDLVRLPVWHEALCPWCDQGTVPLNRGSNDAIVKST